MSKNKTFKAAIMSGILLASFAGASNQNQAFSSQRVELGPNDDLIYAVEGCKSGAALFVGMICPPVGVAIAASPSSESPDDLKKIQKALDKGADINHRDNGSWTALMHASYGGYTGIAEFLVRQGARKDLAVTTGSWKGYTAYTIAKHYLDRYERSIKDCKPDMVGYYRDYISTYSRLTNLLK